MASKQILVIYNPSSGTVGDLDRRLGEIVRAFGEKRGYVVHVRAIEPNMRGHSLFNEFTDELDMVVAVGGDGTVGSVLGAVAESGLDVPVGIVPFGTGNLLARSLGICPASRLADVLDQAMDTIFHGRTIAIDLGRMNGRWFTIDAGTGPISDAITVPRRKAKAVWKLFVYFFPLLLSITRRPLRYELKLDGGETIVVEASGLFVTNGSEMGIGMRGTGHLADGTLDLIVMNPKTVSDYARILMRFVRWFIFGETTEYRPYFVMKLKSVKIELLPRLVPRGRLHQAARLIRDALAGEKSGRGVQKAALAMIDGEPCGTTPMYIDIVPDAVKVRVPARFAEEPRRNKQGEFETSSAMAESDRLS